MNNTVLVTGATGNVGSEVIRSLKKLNMKFYAGVRDLDKGARFFKGEADLLHFDFSNRHSFSSLKNATKLFLVRPPEISDAERFIKPVIDSARDYEIKHIVFLSLIGADKNRFVPHRKIEEFIKDSGIPFTFLRAGFFMQNLNTEHLEEIRDRNEILIPAGSGRTSFIDVRDIAEAAAFILKDDDHLNKAYDLTGSEAISYYETADILTEVLGRKITYTNPSVLRFIKEKLSSGIPLPKILVMSAIYTTARLGLAGRVSNDISVLLGRPPVTIKQYIEDYSSCWKK